MQSTRGALMAALAAILTFGAACQGAPAPSPGGASAPGAGSSGAPSAGGAGPAGSGSSSGGAAVGASAGSAAGTSAGGAAGASAQPASAPRRGGTFIMVISGDPSSINPGLTSGNSEQAAGCIPYQGLVYVDANYNPQPLLAESWEVSPDKRTYTFKLRQGVRWHDGQPFTAEDVRFSYEEVLAKYHPRSQTLFSKLVQSVEAPDPATVRVTLREVYGPFLSQVDCEGAPILPKHVFAGTDIPTNPRNRQDVVGTGPFKLDSWVPGDRITFMRNEQYWVPGEPYLDRVILRIIPEPAARIAALQAGEIDYIRDTDVAPQDFLRLKDDPRLVIGYNKNHPREMMLTLNVQRAPMDSKAFRQAIYQALDREAIEQQVFFGLAKAARGAISVDLPWAYNREVDLTRQYPYNPQRANQLLDQAGLPRGADGRRTRPLKFTVEAARTGFAQVAQIVERNLAAVGVPLVITPMERQVMIDTVYVKRDFDVNLNQLNTAGDPAIGYQRQYTCANIVPVQFTNGAGYCNPTVDRLFEDGATEAENRERAPYYYELQKVLADELPVLPLIHLGAADLGSNKFQYEGTFWQGAAVYSGWAKLYQRAD